MFTRILRDVYAVSDLPVLYMPRYKSIFIADVHLGFEEEMASKGVFLPRIQVKRAIEVVMKALDLVDAENLVIVGDLKHLFERLGRREARDVTEFLSAVQGRFRRIILVRGNHDTFVYVKLRKFGVEIVDELWIDDVLVVHGHKPLSARVRPRIVIMAHEHPSIAIRDPLGTVAKLPCFLVVPLKRGATAVVMPALGMYQSGTAVSTSNEAYLSPILKSEGLLHEAKPFAIVEGEGVCELPRLGIIESFLQTTL